MCKKLALLILTLMISLSVCACGISDKDMDIYEKIHKNYLKMESYSADIDMTVFSNKTQNRYFVSQKTENPDKFYSRVTDPDGLFSVTTATKSGTTKVTADGSDYAITIPADDCMSFLFVNNFLSAYYGSESTFLSVDSTPAKNSKTTLIVDIDEPDSAILRVSMTFDNETCAPLNATVYGKNEQTLVSAVYENFKFNDKIDQSVFCTD